MRERTRSGFALAAILWVLTVASIVAAAAALQGRSAFNAARNRVNGERAYWAAEGCIATTLAGVDRVLGASTQVQMENVWRRLDAVVDSARGVSDPSCAVSLRAEGSAIDVNGASEQLLRKFFIEIAGSAQGDTYADALLDWRDQDSIPRPAGAEAAWYVANERPSPRNDSLAADAELLFVRGLDGRPDLLQYLTVESSVVCLTTAPGPVLAALPGFTPESVDRVLSDRSAGRPLPDLATLIARVSRTAAESLLTHYPELAAATMIEPRLWALTTQVDVGRPAITVRTKVWFDRYGDHVVIARHRSQ